MKIGLICQNYPPATFEGGISHYSRLLAEGLNKRGHDVYAIASTEFTKPLGDIASSDHVEIICIKGPWKQKAVSDIKAIVEGKGLEAVILQFSPASFSRSFRPPFVARK